MKCRNEYNEPALTGQYNFLFNATMHVREIATWIWIYLISKYTSVSNLPDEIFNRLYREPKELGDLFQYFFGYENAERYMQNMSEGITLVKEIIDAEIAQNSDLVNERVRQLYKTVDERAVFLHSINPYWDEQEIRNLWYTFYRYTLEEISAFLNGEIEKSINIYDLLLHHADLMGNYLTQGLSYYVNTRPQGAT